MRIRRYYQKGVKYPYTISQEYFERLLEERGEDVACSIDNAHLEIVFDDEEEEREFFFECLRKVYENPRWWLDNLENRPEFRVNITRIFPHKKK